MSDPRWFAGLSEDVETECPGVWWVVSMADVPHDSPFWGRTLYQRTGPVGNGPSVLNLSTVAVGVGEGLCDVYHAEGGPVGEVVVDGHHHNVTGEVDVRDDPTGGRRQGGRDFGPGVCRIPSRFSLKRQNTLKVVTDVLPLPRLSSLPTRPYLKSTGRVYHFDGVYLVPGRDPCRDRWKRLSLGGPLTLV